MPSASTTTDQSTHGESSQANPRAGSAASATGKSAQCTAHAIDADIPARSNAAVVFRLCCSIWCSLGSEYLLQRADRIDLQAQLVGSATPTRTQLLIPPQTPPTPQKTSFT